MRVFQNKPMEVWQALALQSTHKDVAQRDVF
jgi:hypothetical protein